MSLIEFWNDHKIDIDISKLNSSAIPVKGKLYHNPCRALEIFGNLKSSDFKHMLSSVARDLTYNELEKLFLPHISGIKTPFGENVEQPPFNWKDSSPMTLALNFTYNTNAIFRILSNLSDQKLIPLGKIDSILESACILLSYIYKIDDGYVIKNINNNINMFIISKVIENVLGKHVYNSEYQEIRLTTKSLSYALNFAVEYIELDIKQQMAISLGRGVAFVENEISSSQSSNLSRQSINEITYKYVENRFSIDARDLLIDMVINAYENEKDIYMCAILDDTVESIADLLWMQQMMRLYSTFKVLLLVNKCQISINFSSSMLSKVFACSHFDLLYSKLNTQLFIKEIYCPLISFQTNFLPPDAIRVIEKADFVYVKGANFFETCQLKDKDTFYAFVVYGPISCLYTGLANFDAVFAFVPKGHTGYVHDKNQSKITTLLDVCK